jgi:threonine synthase
MSCRWVKGRPSLIRLERVGKELSLTNLFLKDEGLCPTGTFKARGASACVSKLKELGVTAIAMPTAGNAGSAFAAYGARAGMEVHIAMPNTAPLSMQKQGSIFDATVYLIEGHINKCAELMGSTTTRHGWFNAATFREPWRVEGKKTMGLELYEQFEGDLPEVIIYPTGGGIGVVAIWKAYAELEQLGWLSNTKSRMISVQAEGCARIIKALDEGKDDTEVWPNITTTIPGLAGPAKSLGDALCLPRSVKAVVPV